MNSNENNLSPPRQFQFHEIARNSDDDQFGEFQSHHDSHIYLPSNKENYPIVAKYINKNDLNQN